MTEIIVGEVITLEDQKEFICFHRIRDNGKNYLYLMSNYKPLEVIFAEEIIVGDVLTIRKVHEPEEKQRLFRLFKETASGQEKPEPIKTLDGEIHQQGIAVGETVELENMGEFVCTQKIKDGDQEYLLLSSKKKLREVLVGKETMTGGVLSVQIVKDQRTTERVLKLARSNIFSTIKQLFKRSKPHK